MQGKASLAVLPLACHQCSSHCKRNLGDCGPQTTRDIPTRVQSEYNEKLFLNFLIYRQDASSSTNQNSMKDFNFYEM